MKTSAFQLLCLYLSLILSHCQGGESEDKTMNNIFDIDAECLVERSQVSCSSADSELKTCFDPSPDAKIKFYLFTPDNKYHPEMLHKCGGMLPGNTKYNCSWPLHVFVHGMCDGVCTSASMRDAKNQVLYRERCNVILVDWTSFTRLPDFLAETKAAKPIASNTCCVLKNILARCSGEMSKSKIHMAGHSAGAHIASMASQCIGKAGKLTGMDPYNGGVFYDAPYEERMNRDAADIVQCIHTNGGSCLAEDMFIGWYGPIGHADFYPDGGSVQTSCFTKLPTYFMKQDFIAGMWSLCHSFCYHLQAWEFFKVSINPCGCMLIGIACESYDDFKSGKCNKTCKSDGSNCAVMGMDFYKYKSSSEPQKYYLKMKTTCPYCDNSGINLNGYPESARKEGDDSEDPLKYCFQV